MSETTHESSNKKQRLGRGLGSLLGNPDVLGASAQTTKDPVIDKRPAQEAPIKHADVEKSSAGIESRVWQVAIDKLAPSQYQPRQHFEKDKLNELAESIRQQGILQPIVARKLTEGRFEIIAGERRWRAAQIAGLHDVPVIFKTLSNKETLELAIIENIQREDLGPIEEAEAYRRLAEEFKLTQQQIAEKVGKERATVANSMRLLLLTDKVRELLVSKQLSAGHAKVLLTIEEPKEQEKMAQRVVADQLSVRALEKACQNRKQQKDAAGAVDGVNRLAASQNARAETLAKELQKALGTKVHIDYREGKGKLVVYYYSNEELSQLCEKLKT